MRQAGSESADRFLQADETAEARPSGKCGSRSSNIIAPRLWKFLWHAPLRFIPPILLVACRPRSAQHVYSY